MAQIILKDVCKVYEKGHYAVNGFSLTIRDGEFVVFVGPSGCGKSTTLRMIAGLEDISQGELWIDDQLCNYAQPGDRDLSMVFQNYALYPQMTVGQNMGFSLSVRKVPKPEIDQRVRQTAQMLGIDHLLNRRPAQLSGGQKQRVAIGSAIMRTPKAFLMDEPLSNLDAKLRVHMRIELAALHQKLGTTVIYVTHDQTEAMTLADRIVVMKEGYIQQVDTPQQIYTNPANLFVAGFIGSPCMNFISGRLCQKENAVFFETQSGQHYPLTQAQSQQLWQGFQGRELVLGVRPENVGINAPAAQAVYGQVQGRVIACEALGHEQILTLESGDGQLCCRVDNRHHAQPGQAASVAIDMAKAHFFDKETERNIFYDWGGVE